MLSTLRISYNNLVTNYSLIIDSFLEKVMEFLNKANENAYGMINAGHYK